MKTKKTKQFKILSVKRGNNSYYGNPSYILGLADDDGNIYYAKTASNAMVGYEVSYSLENTNKQLTYHFTKNGNMIIDALVR